MKFVTYIKNKLNSIAYYWLRLMETASRVDFIKPYVDSPLYGETYYISSSSRGRKIRKIFDQLMINENDSIIDVGCGKGRAMYLMRKYPFRKIDGIEMDSYLSNIAVKNFKTLKENRVTVFNTDAINFSNYKDYNYYYLYNPFSVEILQKVIFKIKDSLEEVPRGITIIYVNPVWNNCMLNNGFIKISESIDEFRNEIFIYKSNLADTSL